MVLRPKRLVFLGRFPLPNKDVRGLVRLNRLFSVLLDGDCEETSSEGRLLLASDEETSSKLMLSAGDSEVATTTGNGPAGCSITTPSLLALGRRTSELSVEDDESLAGLASSSALLRASSPNLKNGSRVVLLAPGTRLLNCGR